MMDVTISGLIGTLKNAFKINKLTLDASALTANRTVTIQDKGGTAALLSDIQASPETTEYNFETSTVNGDPGAGRFRFNNATRANTTAIYMNKVTALGVDASNALNLLAINDTLFFQDKDNGSSTVRYKVSGAVVLTGNYYNIPVTVDVAPAGLELTNNARTLVVYRIAAFGGGGGAELTVNKDASNGYAGLTLFKINFKNVANTFTSFFTNSNTAPRTYNYQDKDYTVAGLTDIKGVCDFRLTLTSGVPVTTADVTAATTIHCTPYNGNSIALYDGTKWNVRQSTEFSIALGTLTNDQAYDVFCYDNAGAPTLELLAWTNNATRATNIALFEGIYVKSGAVTRRYLGSFLTTSTTTTESSVTKRCLYNYYNQVESTLKKYDASTYAYTTATRRQANGSTANQVIVFKGLNDKPVELMASVGFVTSSSVTIITVSVSIGLDSTTVVASDCLASFAWVTSTSSAGMSSLFNGYVGLGKHVLVWQEYGGTGVTFQGTTVGITSSGLLGSTYC